MTTSRLPGKPTCQSEECQQTESLDGSPLPRANVKPELVTAFAVGAIVVHVYRHDDDGLVRCTATFKDAFSDDGEHAINGYTMCDLADAADAAAFVGQFVEGRISLADFIHDARTLSISNITSSPNMDLQAERISKWTKE